MQTRIEQAPGLQRRFVALRQSICTSQVTSFPKREITSFSVSLAGSCAGVNIPGVSKETGGQLGFPALAEKGGIVKKGVKDDPSTPELLDRLNAMSRGRKIILVVFIIWAIQAIPKWTAAIVADGETSAAIMTFFITPR